MWRLEEKTCSESRKDLDPFPMHLFHLTVPEFLYIYVYIYNILYIFITLIICSK